MEQHQRAHYSYNKLRIHNWPQNKNKLLMIIMLAWCTLGEPDALWEFPSKRCLDKTLIRPR